MGNRAWQCTHVSGHRFAANVLVFPEGLTYGRLSPGDAARLAAATDQKEIFLEHLRGRACYEPVVQTAESFVRQREDAPQFGRFRFQDARSLEEEQWQVRFTDNEIPAVYQLVVRIDRSTDQEYQSCKGDKQVPSLVYKLVDYQILHGPSEPSSG